MSMARHLNDVDAVAAPQAEDSSLFEHVGEGVVHAQRFSTSVNLNWKRMGRFINVQESLPGCKRYKYSKRI